MLQDGGGSSVGPKLGNHTREGGGARTHAIDWMKMSRNMAESGK
jgi:hypothetical protein